MNQVNYQKELDKVIDGLVKENRIPGRPACFCIAAVHHAAAIVWNICAVIF